MKNAVDWIITIIISVCLLIVIYALVFGGIGKFFKEPSKPTEEGVKWFEYVDMNVIRHRETGVCYYVTEDYITPLYNADGSLYVLGG